MFLLTGAQLPAETSPALAAHTGVQSFSEEAPADIFVGPMVLHVQVLHRAVDGSWLKFRAQSHWGSFSYWATRVGAEPGAAAPRSASPTPPPGVIAARDTPWEKIQSSGAPSWLWLEGAITATKNSGAELEGRFNFKDEVVRLHLTLVENNPLGADPVPTWRNIFYGPDVRQKLDVYLAKSAQPTPVAIFIHGGGWTHGDKTGLIGQRSLLAAGISVIAIDYRYIPSENPSATTPAVAVPLGDAARAIQFVRSKAAEWKLDPKRIGVWGASAGAFSSLWLATHPDMKDPMSSDPVARESTRPTCAAGIFPQTSLDPAQMRAWVGPMLTYGPHAFAIKTVAGQSRFDSFIADREKVLPWIKEYSPAALVNRTSAPIFLDFIDFDLKPCEPLDSYYTHSPGFGVGFLQVARAAGADCHLRYVGHEDDRYSGWEQFLIARLTQ